MSLFSAQDMTIVGTLRENEEMVLENVEVYEIKCAYGLTEDKDQNGIADYIDFMNGQHGDPDITPTPTVTPVPSVTPTNTPTPTLTTEPTPTPDPEQDSDGDGIPDSVEAELGTNPYSPDSDNDGVDDNIEVMVGLDPLSDDSDGDGIPDGQEDDDGDGLPLIEEIAQGTYTWTDDTDVDGISDGDEVHIYGTDPLNEDTDGDTIEDGDELKLGTDPLVPDSDGDGIPDGEERFLQTREEEINNAERPVVTKVDITLEGTGCLDSVMTIEDTYGKDKYSSELVGLVGSPVEISYEGEFSEATITFHYDENLLSSNKPNIPDMLPIEDAYVTNPRSLGIFYYDEETGMYIDCGATVDTTNHTITCTTTHFSTYMVSDMSIWHYFWTSMKYVGDLRPSHEGYQGIDYVLEIPYISSMTEEDIAEMNEIAYQIIDHMQEGDRMVVRGWNSGGVYQYEYSINKAELREQVGKWPWKDGDCWVGYQSGPHGLIGSSLNGMEIFNIASSTHYHNENNELVVIAFHNSTDIDCQFYSTYHRSVKEMTAYIFTLSSGNSSSISLQWLNVASGGGVIDCEGKTAEEVFNEFTALYAKRQGEDLDPHDDNSAVGDGLWDIYEEQGMLCSNGRVYKADPGLVDTDGDTLSDNYEMGDCYQIEVDDGNCVYFNGYEANDLSPESLVAHFFIQFGKGRWTIYAVRSNPSDEDTDHDDARDDVDATPCVFNEDITYIIYGSEWEKDADYWEGKYDDQCKVVTYECDDWGQFKTIWQSLGKQKGKNAYSIDRVLLLYHGTIGAFFVGNTAVATDFRDDIPAHISELSDSRIRVLDMKICESGRLSAMNIYPSTYVQGSQDSAYGYNIALQFLMSIPSITSVRAWNGTYCIYNNIFGHYERCYYSDTDYEECCYIFYKDNDGNYEYYKDTNTVKTGIYKYYTP